MQYVYGKNVIKQLLKDNKTIHEIILQEGVRDHVLES